MDAVLNQNTKTVHKRRRDATARQTVCGHTAHVDADRLRMTTIERATTSRDIRRCGGCFEDAGGY